MKARLTVPWLVASVLSTYIWMQPVCAQDSDQANTAGKSPAAAPADTPAPGLQAGVQKVELSLEKLRDLGVDLKHLLAGAGHLYDEVNITPVSLITMPEVIGRGTVINIPVGTMPSGPPAPPRKDRLDLAMAQITPTINWLKANVDEFAAGHQTLDISDDLREQLKPTFEQWEAAVNDMAGQLKKLQGLCAGPTYDNSSISQTAVQLQSDCNVLQKDLKKIYKAFQKEGKKSKRS